MGKNSKKIMSLVLATSVMASLLVGCGGKNSSDKAEGDANENKKSIYEMSEQELIDAAKAEGSVTFAVWHDESLWKEIGTGFEEKYGIKVSIAMGEKQALTSKVIAEKQGKKGSIDVMKVGGEDTKTTIDAKVFMGPTLKSVKGNELLDPGLSVRQEGVEHEGYLVPLHRNQTGLLYNPDKVKNPPQTWEELSKWIDENPKQFGFCDPSKGGSGQAFVFTAINNLTGGLDKYYGDEGVDEADVADWDKVWSWFNERKDKVTITTSNKDSLSRLNQGELSLVVAWDDQATSTIKSGELFKNAKLYIPEMGLPGGGDSAGILANAPHPAAALLFLNYMVEADTQAKLNEVLNTYPSRTDVAVVNSLINSDEFKNRIEWIPAQYKKKFIDDFVKNVLMKQ